MKWGYFNSYELLSDSEKVLKSTDSTRESPARIVCMAEHNSAHSVQSADFILRPELLCRNVCEGQVRISNSTFPRWRRTSMTTEISTSGKITRQAPWHALPVLGFVTSYPCVCSPSAIL